MAKNPRRKEIEGTGKTREELVAYLPADCPRWLRAVCAARFTTPLTLDEMLACLGRAPMTVAQRIAWTRPEPLPPAAQPPTVQGEYLCGVADRGRVVWRIHRAAGHAYLTADFPDLGARWNSNRAWFWMFLREVLPLLHADDVTDVTT